LTRHYEKPFNPDFGSNLDAILFENFSSLTSSMLENEIRNVVANYEPRASINDVQVSPGPDMNTYSVYLSFYIENATLPTTITLLLERNR
jgi:phage baseplate assembly protein W